MQTLRVYNSRILRNKNAKFSGYYLCMNRNIKEGFQIFINVPLRKMQTLWVNNWRILMIQNARFSWYYFYMNTNIWRDCQICISVPLIKLNIRRTTRDGEGGGDLRCPFLKIEKSALILEKRLWFFPFSIFHSKCSFKSIC